MERLCNGCIAVAVGVIRTPSHLIGDYPSHAYSPPFCMESNEKYSLYEKKLTFVLCVVVFWRWLFFSCFPKFKVHSPPSLGKLLRQDSPRNKVRTSPVATVSQRCFSIITYKLIKSTVFVKINELMAEILNVSQGGVVGVCEIKWRVGV